MASRFCATRKRVKDKVAEKIEIVNTPGDKDYPVDQCLHKLELMTTTTAIDTTTDKTTDDHTTAILRLDEEVQSVLEKERNRVETMIGTASTKLLETMMYEQRVEGIKKDEQIDDIRRIVSGRDEALQDQLTMVLEELQLMKADRARVNLQENTRKTEPLLEKDKRYGQPLCWAQAAEDIKQRDNVQEMQIYTPTTTITKYDEDPEKLIQKWSDAKLKDRGLEVPATEIVDGSIVNGFNKLVLKHIGQTAESDNEDDYKDRPQTGIDFSRIPPGNVDNENNKRDKLQTGIDFSLIPPPGSTRNGYTT